MRLSSIKEKFLKFFLVFSVCISLWGGPAAGHEISKMLECLSGVRDEKIQELDAEGDVAEERKKTLK
jgi:hypothetical protein